MSTTTRSTRRINVVALPVTTRRSTRPVVVVDVDALLERPRDPDDLVAALRFAVAWTIEGGESVDELAARAGVEVDRLAGFLRATARVAGELLTIGEVGRLARALELRVADRELLGEHADAWKIAECYIEVAMADGIEGSYRRALREARQVRRRFRATWQTKRAAATA